MISVIIAAKNARPTIDKCLNSLLQQSCRDYEIIVVNDGSTDKTGDILAGYHDIKILNTPGVGPAKARNIGVEQARGEFIAFTDADCIVEKDWLLKLLEGFREYPDAVACGGSQQLPADAGNFQKKIFKFMKKSGFLTGYMQSGSRIRESAHNPSCNVLYKAKEFRNESGFLEGLWPGEDVELDYRLKKKGRRIIFNPEAIVYHYRPDSFKRFLGMMYRYGAAQGFLVRRYGIFRKIHFLPLLTLLLAIAAFLVIPAYSLPLIELIVFIGLISVLVYFAFDIQIFILAILGFACWHAGFLLGFLQKKTA